VFFAMEELYRVLLSTKLFRTQRIASCGADGESRSSMRDH